jgi:hypothetical protein
MLSHRAHRAELGVAGVLVQRVLEGLAQEQVLLPAAGGRASLERLDAV